MERNRIALTDNDGWATYYRSAFVIGPTRHEDKLLITPTYVLSDDDNEVAYRINLATLQGETSDVLARTIYLTDEQMQELFVAYITIKEEHEGKVDLKNDADQEA